MLSKLKSDNYTVSRVYLCSCKIQLSFYNTKCCKYVCQTQGEDFADQREYVEHVRLRRPVLTFSEIIAKIQICFLLFLFAKKLIVSMDFEKHLSVHKSNFQRLLRAMGKFQMVGQRVGERINCNIPQLPNTCCNVTDDMPGGLE